MSAGAAEAGLGHFEGKTHILPLRIYYEDTDLSGMVYHANYLRYMERGRTEFFRLAGITKMADLEERRAHRLGDPHMSRSNFTARRGWMTSLEVHTVCTGHQRRAHDAHPANLCAADVC